jgi:hypothetical protein
MSIFRYPRLGQELRGSQEGWNRPGRGKMHLPMACDDRIRRPQRSWKKHRETQYRPVETAGPATKQSTPRRGPAAECGR